MKAIYLCMAAMAVMLTACGSKTNSANAAEEGAENLVEAPAGKVTAANYPRVADVITYTTAEYPEQIQPDAELPVIIDFNATWCGPCKRFSPTFEAAAKAHGNAIFLSVDVDDNPKAAEQFGVGSIPMVVVLMPDGTTRSTIGYMDDTQFAEFLGF